MYTSSKYVLEDRSRSFIRSNVREAQSGRNSILRVRSEVVSHTLCVGVFDEKERQHIF